MVLAMHEAEKTNFAEYYNQYNILKIWGAFLNNGL